MSSAVLADLTEITALLHFTAQHNSKMAVILYFYWKYELHWHICISSSPCYWLYNSKVSHFSHFHSWENEMI